MEDIGMKLTENTKNQAENEKSKEEKKGLIETAGKPLTEDEPEMVTAGCAIHRVRKWDDSWKYRN